jgi:phosphodiester glycosidase
MVLMPAAPAQLAAQAAARDAATVVWQVTPGVTIRRMYRPEGPWRVYAAEIGLATPDVAVRAVRACDLPRGRERPTAIARRLGDEGIDPLVLLNADFFDLRGGTGVVENSMVIDGEIAKAVPESESPFDTFDNAHAQIGLTVAGKPVLERFTFDGRVTLHRREWPLRHVNATPAVGELALLTRWSDEAVRERVASAARLAVQLRRDGSRGDTVLYRVAASAIPLARLVPAAILAGEALLAGSARAADALARLRAGDRVTIVQRFSPDRGPLQMLVGGWPRLLDAGRSVAAHADSIEGTFARFSQARHPRSAVGFSRDSATLYLIAVDGRQEASVGATLEELATILRDLGAHDALNLDGGGSTALVVGGALTNVPSDSAGERPVGNVIAVTRRSAGSAPVTRAAPAAAPPPSCLLPPFPAPAR